jgi:adenosylcobinamide kinase/adenosylcobinamide-phosphate guanylyltransferase
VLYVATATATDDEMTERIRLHRARRPATWRTLEAPTLLAERVVAELGASRTVLIEDLTLALSNLMLSESADAAERAAVRDVDALLGVPANLILVSNEVGMGIVPPYPLGRQFRDALGRLNQYVAAHVNDAYLLVAGLPLRLK